MLGKRLRLPDSKERGQCFLVGRRKGRELLSLPWRKVLFSGAWKEEGVSGGNDRANRHIF